MVCAGSGVASSTREKEDSGNVPGKRPSLAFEAAVDECWGNGAATAGPREDLPGAGGPLAGPEAVGATVGMTVLDRVRAAGAEMMLMAGSGAILGSLGLGFEREEIFMGDGDLDVPAGLGRGGRERGKELFGLPRVGRADAEGCCPSSLLIGLILRLARVADVPSVSTSVTHVDVGYVEGNQPRATGESYERVREVFM